MKVYSSFTELQNALNSKTITCVEVVNSYLLQIKKHNHLNAFIEVYENDAIERAKEIDEKILRGTAGKLAGLVIGNKDVINHKGYHTTSASKILNGYKSIYNATAIDKLLKEDAIIIGRCNCDEFAMGSSNENSFYGNVKNGLDENKVPGGSSGGSAVAVQMDMCMVALGTDTGGSIRQPASFCGVFGIKPTYGRVSRYGLIAYASGFKKLFSWLNEKGNTVTATEFNMLDYLVPAYYLLTTAEASSNLSRFDGIRYGYRSENANDLESTYKKNRSEGFGREVKRRIMLGTFVLSAGYYDAYYSKAQKVRRVIREQTEKILEQNDFIIIPTTPSTAFGIGEKTKDPIEMYLADIYTVQANITGLPAVSIPLGKHSNGLPYGVQVMSKRFSETELLSFSKYLMENLKSI